MRRSFSQAERKAPGKGKQALHQSLTDLDRRIAKLAALSSRIQARKARTDMRDWARARRERTRHLIELGGLVQKAGLVELTDDDRATMLGAFLDLANQIRGYGDTPPDSLKIRWRRAGLHAFDAEKDAAGKEEETDREKRSPDDQARPRGAAT